MIRIVLVDDQTLVRQGIRSLLGLVSDLSIVAEAADGDEERGQAREQRERAGLGHEAGCGKGVHLSFDSGRADRRMSNGRPSPARRYRGNPTNIERAAARPASSAPSGSPANRTPAR